jgi:tetratricopeptide (TPR) repeat protein
MLALLDEPLEPSGWAETDVSRPVERALLLRAAGRVDYSVPEVRDAVISMMEIAVSHVPLVFSDAVDCAFAAAQPGAVQELIDRVDALPPSQLLPLLEAEAARARARLAVSRGEREDAEHWYKRAVHLFDELATPFYLARAQLEYAELLAQDGDDAAAGALHDEAARVFESLDARPWLERAQALVSEVAA